MFMMVSLACQSNHCGFFFKMEKKGRSEETKPLRRVSHLSVDIIINPNFKSCSSVLVSEGHRIRAHLQ